MVLPTDRLPHFRDLQLCGLGNLGSSNICDIWTVIWPGRVENGIVWTETCVCLKKERRRSTYTIVTGGKEHRVTLEAKFHPSRMRVSCIFNKSSREFLLIALPLLIIRWQICFLPTITNGQDIRRLGILYLVDEETIYLQTNHEDPTHGITLKSRSPQCVRINWVKIR